MTSDKGLTSFRSRLFWLPVNADTRRAPITTEAPAAVPAWPCPLGCLHVWVSPPPHLRMCASGSRSLSSLDLSGASLHPTIHPSFHHCVPASLSISLSLPLSPHSVKSLYSTLFSLRISRFILSVPFLSRKISQRISPTSPALSPLHNSSILYGI